MTTEQRLDRIEENKHNLTEAQKRTQALSEFQGRPF